MLSQKAFLVYDVTRNKFIGTNIEQQSFVRYLRKYRNGKLKNNAKKKNFQVKLSQFEEILVKYLGLRAEKYKRNKCGITWTILTTKTLQFTKTCGVNSDGFLVSPRWIQNVLSRNDIIGLNLHGEADDIDDDEREEIMKKQKKENFFPIIEKHNIDPSRIFNVDQTGLYYTKLLNRLYIEHSRKKNYTGVKQMKDKHRVTIMILIAANGKKYLLSLIGEAKKNALLSFGTKQKGINPLYQPEKCLV